VQSHFLKYAALAANLQPLLSERLDFSQSTGRREGDVDWQFGKHTRRSSETAVSSHKQGYVKRKSTDSDSRDSNKGPPCDRYCDSGTGRRLDAQVRQVRYVKESNSPYRQGANNRRQNNPQNGRLTDNTSQSDLNLYAPEFEPRTINSR
jgi:hypothetical protein